MEEGIVYIIDIEEDAAVEAEKKKNAKPIEFYKPEEPKKKKNDDLTN